MKNIKYVLGSFFIIGGIGNIFKNSVLGGLFLVTLGLLIFPPVSEKLLKAFELLKNKYIRYGLYLVLFVLAGSFIKNIDKHTSTTSTKVAAQEVKISKDTKKEPIELDHAKFWDKYDPIVKQRVYKMMEEKDCVGLQQEFEITADNMDKLQATGKSGERNLSLMQFLEERMKELDCH